MLNLESIRDYQKQLSNLIGVSGYEEDVSNFILSEIEDNNLADKCWIDPLGNVLAIREGTEGSERILLDAHIDEIGFMISHIEKSGFLRFVSMGSWDKRILLGQPVILRSHTKQNFHGLISSTPPHLTTAKERNKVVEIPNMYIDVAMSSETEVIQNGINVGTIGTLFSPYIEFSNNMVRGKAFDDRTGCNVILHVMKLLKENKNLTQTFLFNFAVQEEVGRKGAITGAFKLKPTMAIAIENTTAADVPGIKESEIPAYIGKGPAITIADKSIISNPKVNDRLIKNAEFEKIPFQFKKPKYGLTDAGVIEVSRGGVPSSVVSVPCRYIHSPTSLLKLTDVYDTVRLINAFIQNPAKI